MRFFPRGGPVRAGTPWGDLGLRVMSAAVLAPLALAAIWHGGAAWLLLLGVGFAGLAIEWVKLCGKMVVSPPGIALLLVVLAAVAAAAAGQEWLGLLLLAAGTVLVRLLSRADRWGRALALGVPYVGLAAVALAWLRGGDEIGRVNLLFVVLVVWSTDIGAYLAGRLLGGPKLAPRISPGKTLAGAGGGLLAAMLVPPAVAAWLVGDAWRLDAALVAAVLSVVAQAGDLLESGIKRRFGVKDSGHLIPGHGGLFDRLDGVLTAAPAAALLAAAAGRGVLL